MDKIIRWLHRYYVVDTETGEIKIEVLLQSVEEDKKSYELYSNNTLLLKSFDDEAIKLYDKLKEMDEFLIKGGPKRVIEVK